MQRVSSLAAAVEAGRSVDPTVSIPDVFPTVAYYGGMVSNLHDIFRGSIPSEKVFAQAERTCLQGDQLSGWLRIAVHTGKIPAYIDPSEDPELVKAYTRSHRAARNIGVILDQVRDVPREEMLLSEVLRTFWPSYATPPREFPLGRSRRRIETARAFSGRVALAPQGTRISGIHFPSSHTNGWAHIWHER